jgi:hypothetical protein
MPCHRRSAALLLFAATLQPGTVSLRAQTRITTPKEQFGAALGDDYFLASYQQIAGYWQQLARESNRIVLKEIGKTAEGRPQLMAIVTAAENQRRLAHYQDIARQLANAEGLSEEQARALARDGKAVVWIDGGLHATEVLGAQQLAEMVYQMVSRDDEETRRFLNDVIVLFVHANPDGNDLVADWYMRNPVPEQRTLAGLPRLYQKYIGHDNNRDFFASTQAETENINRVLYHEWFPQILYNHHQSGPAGTVVYSPPLRDPYNFNLDPVLILGLQSLGAAMHTRLALEGKGGATMRSGGPYDGWWNGGIRNTATFHNTIAIADPLRRATADSRRRPGAAGGAPGMALPPVDRILDHLGPGGAGLRVPDARKPAVQHLRHGKGVHRAREPRYLDRESPSHRRSRPQLRCAGRRRQPGRADDDPERRLQPLGGPAPARAAGPSRVHHPIRPARLSDRHQIRQRAAGDRYHGASRQQ